MLRRRPVHTLTSMELPGEAKESRDAVYNAEGHESHLSHEVVAGGAAFEAMKLFEDRQRRNGTFESPPQRLRVE